jgi:hypothetical protein
MSRYCIIIGGSKSIGRFDILSECG